MSWKDSLPASKTYKRYVCPGSHYLESLYPEVEKSETAKDGIVAHNIAAKILDHRMNCCYDNSKADIEHSEFSEDFDEEMKSAIDFYVNEVICFCLSYHNSDWRSCEFGIEDKFIGGIHPRSKSIIDSFAIFSKLDYVNVIIWDFKYGYKPIEAYNNFQLLAYALSLYEQFSGRLPRDSTEFILRIVQPRVFKGDKIKEWRLSLNQLLRFRPTLDESESLALTEDAPRAISEECLTCRARHACPTLQNASLNAIKIISENTPYSLPAENIGNELRILEYAKDILTARITGLQEQTIQYLKNGERVNFYKLEQSTGRLNWSIPPKKLRDLELLTGVNLIKESPITPRQAMDAGVPEDFIKRYTSRKAGELKLTQQSEKDLQKLFN